PGIISQGFSEPVVRRGAGFQPADSRGRLETGPTQDQAAYLQHTMSTQTIGQFQVLGNLGSGAHSKILHIRCSGDGKQYALKVVPIDSKEDHKFLAQAQHEFRVAQMLSHPNLIKVYALETERSWLMRVKRVHLLIE